MNLIIVSSWHYFTECLLNTLQLNQVFQTVYVVFHHPVVGVFQEDVETGTHLDPSLKEISYNPTYDTMFAPEVRSVCSVCFQSCQSFL